MEVGGSVLTVEKVKNQDLIFITPRGKRIKAFEELRKPQWHAELSLSRWNPTVALEIPMIRKTTASKGKFVWTDKMDQEYGIVRKTMLEQIQLTPFDSNKSLRLVIDGASTEGVGFELFLWVDKMNLGDRAVIVNANCTRFKESHL